MAVEQKIVELDKTDYKSEQSWAEHTKGVYMNLLGGCRWDPIDNKYHVAKIHYSDCDLTGEKIKFASGQELTVLYSCLAEEYANKQEVKDTWWAKTRELVENYKEQVQLENHIKTNNTDLKRLRKEGALLEKDELDKEE